MPKVEKALGSMVALDDLALNKTTLQSLDPRSKLITTLVFIVAATSFGKYDLLGILPLVFYPVSLMALGNIPAWEITKKILYVSPFAVFIGIFNPVFDREILVQFGSIAITGGWISFTVIIVKFVLTVSVALILVATSGFDSICLALARLKVPQVFVVQLMFIYRYIFVMVEEASRMIRAHNLRSFRKRRIDLRIFVSMIGQLLLRTLDRAQRIHTAMISRGFTGDIRLIRELKAGLIDWVFFLGWAVFFILVRMYNIPELLGLLVMGVLT